MTDSPEPDRLQFLSEPIVTANHSFIRWHGRQVKPRYNYLYSRDELKSWVEKVKQLSTETAVVRGYFNNHYGARAVVNAIEFKGMLGTVLSPKEIALLENAGSFFFETSRQSTLDKKLKEKVCSLCGFVMMHPISESQFQNFMREKKWTFMFNYYS